MLTGCVNNEELILHQVQPVQGKSDTQDSWKIVKGLSPCKNILNFYLSAFGIGYEQFSLQKGLWFLFHSAKIDRQQVCQSDKLALYDLLSQFSWDWSMPRTNSESFLRFGPDAE